MRLGSYEEAHSLKENKYADLVQKIREADVYHPEIITLEVGSRGPLHLKGFNNLKTYLNAATKEWEAMLVSITRTVITESHKIWTIRNWRDPINK